MKRMLKKAVSVLLCLATLFTVAPFSDLFATKAEAAVNWDDLGIDFSVNEYIAGIITNTNHNSCAISDDSKSIGSIDLDYYTQPQNASLSKCYTAPLESDAQFMASVATWEVLTFSPTDIYNESLTEIGYYQAILFEILNTAVDYDFIPSIVKSTNKHVISTVSAINKLGIKLDDIVVNGNTQWDLLNADQQHKIIQETAKHMNKLEMRGQDLSNISGIIETATTVIDYVEKTSQLYALTTLTEDVKTVINELSANSSFLDNPEMKTAISEIENAMISKFENIGTIGLELVGSGTKLAMDIFLNQMWGECVSATLGSLGTGLLIGQVIGRGLSNILFSTDETIKQFYMMQALEDFEELMCKSVKSLGNKYSSSPNSSNASAFLKSIDLLYNTYMLDFEYAADYAEIMHKKGLVNKIKLFLSGEPKDLAQINSIVSSMKNTVSMTLGMMTDLDSYRWYLETDYPDVYAVYYGGLSDEDVTNRYIEKVRALTVACPTDVDIYNADNEVVVSVKNNKVELCMPGYFCVVEDDIKYLVVSAESPSEIVITGTDEGKMTYSIYEADEHGFKRTMKFKDVELTKGCSFEADLPQNIRQASEKYVLISDEGKTIKPNFDTQPEINTEITDIIVSEELFEGFSTELIDKVANAMFKFEPVVDITSYNISTDDTVALFSAISKYYPTEYSLLTKGDFKYKIIFSPSLGYITDIRFYYGDDANLEAFEQRNKDLKAEIDKIVAQVEEMNDFEKALYIHDYIVLNSEYDLELLEMLESGGTLSGELYTEKYSEYSILINGTGICGSYALAYRALMNAAGVDCLYLSSQQMNHAWNMVKIDGEWYHVDCCWDDPVPDTYGDARRTYFLRTDAEIMELNHYSWVPGTYKATSTLYSDMPRNYNSKQKYEDGYWYILNYSKVYKTDLYGNNKEDLFVTYSSSIDIDDGDIYYSSGTGIYYYDLSKEKAVPSYNVPYSQYSGYSYSHIRNFEVNGTEISYYLFKESGSGFVCTKYTGVSQKDLYDNINEIKLNYESYDLYVFDKITLIAEIVADGEYEGVSLQWHTSDETVASVTNNGVVRGNKTGTATITVSFGDFKDSCEVVVTSDTQSGYCGENVTWEFIEETKHLLIKGSGEMYDYNSYSSESPWADLSVISAEIGSGITRVGDYSFYNSNISSMIIGKDIKIIGSHSFYSCDNLAEINLPSQLKTIGSNAFEYCYSLERIVIPNSVTEIKSAAFSDCDLIESISIPFGVTTVGSSAFSNCDKLKSASISGSVQEIGSNAFEDCRSLEILTLQNGIKIIGSSAFIYCEKLTSVVLPDSITEIGNKAFYDCCNITAMYIPANVSVIGDCAFVKTKNLQGFKVNSNNVNFKNDEVGVLYSKDESKLICFPIANGIAEYTVPKEVVCIEDYAFDSCVNLQKVVVLGNLETTGENTFNNCTGLEEISFNGGVKEIGDHTFYGCTSLKSFIVPDEVTTLGTESFYGCINMTQIVLPEGITEISNSCFGKCSNLKEIILPESLEKIGAGAFYGCNAITSLHIPKNVASIQSWPNPLLAGVLGFVEGKSVYDVYLHDYEVDRFWNKFFDAEDLEFNLSSYLFFGRPEDVLNDQVGTFNCLSLQSITVDSDNKYFACDENGILFNKEKTVLIRMPQNSPVTEYIVPDTVLSTAYSAFENCDNLQKVTVPDSVTHIGDNAFADCDNLKEATVSNVIDKIRENTFKNCISLADINIPESVLTIRQNAFANCESLESVVIPQNVSELEWGAFYSCDNLSFVEILGTTTGNEAFSDCKKLEEVVLSNNIVSVGSGAFMDCSSLIKINIPASVQEIGAGAFANCSALKSIVIPDTVQKIDYKAFENCDGLLAVSIGSSVTEIPAMVFYDCDGLESVLIPSTVTQIHATAFHKCDSLKKIAILNPSCIITRPGLFDSGYFDYIKGMETKQCTLWGYSGSTAEEFAGKTGGFVANFKSFEDEIHNHEYFAIEYNSEEISEDKQYHKICYCGIHCGELLSEEFNCEFGGYRKTKCCYCALEQDETLEASEHSLVIKTETFGTCINPGVKIYECTVCGYTEEVLKSADEGHSYTETVTAPTCTEIGYTTATCEHCGENAMYDFVPMLGHDVTVTHTDADCKKCAQTEYSCSRCDYHEIIVDEESGLGEHKISVTVTEATCTENGSIDRICVTCNELFSTEVVASNGHILGEWETATDATTESAGKKEKRCIVCKELVEVEEIPKIPVNVTGILLTESEIEISNKGTHLLTATVSPENADDRTVTWVSDDPSVATVDENGLVTAVSIGETTVSVTTTDGGYTATCEITILPRAFTLTWVVDGVSTEEKLNEAAEIIKLENPKKTGYTFTGWTPEVPDIMPAEDLTFTATWTANTYDAVFDANGGKWADGAAEKNVPTAFDSQITAPEAPVKQGYIFSKWSPEVGVMDSVDGKRFVAEWIAAADTRYTVETYTMNTSSKYVKTTNTFKGTTGESVSVKPTVQTGFTLNKSKSVLSGNVAADNSLVLKVYIDRNTYTLTTVADGVSTSTRYLYGSLIAEPATPVKTGYKFIEWDKTLPETMPAKNITLTAVFDTAYTCPDCGDEIVGENAIAEHIAAEARAKSTVSIKNNPESKTIKYGETLRLTAIASKPDDVVICWYVDGVKKGEGTTFDLKFESGTKTVEVKLEDADGNTVCNSSGAEISDSEEVTVNAGFFQKIISFFKNLFRMDRTVIQ